MKAFLFCLVVLAGVVPASAAPYAHKAGVTAEQFDLDQSQCLQAAEAARVTESNRPDPLGRGAKEGVVYRETYLSCLEARGYTHRIMPKAEEKALLKLPKAEQAARFRMMTSAPQPLHPPLSRAKGD
jgi:hypothetical protein